MRYIFFTFWCIFNAVAAAEDVRPEYVDFNFDGYPDKKVFVSSGGGRNAANRLYKIWLYDPKTKDFVLHEQLSGLGDPQPEASSKTIRSFWRSTPIDTIKVCKWEGSRLVTIETITYESKDGGIQETVRRVKDGKLQTVSTSFHEAH